VELLDYLRRQFSYDEWANRELLAVVRAGGEVSQRTLQLMAHILSAERLWLERLIGKPQSLPVWPEMSLPQCEQQVPELARLWRDYLSAGRDLAQTISYKNSKGELWTSTVEQVLTHVVMHSAYHRGQIASHMRASGLTPAYTDFIHSVRQGADQVDKELLKQETLPPKCCRTAPRPLPVCCSKK
jgi:uncharacterized damage-inducible protein DinB